MTDEELFDQYIASHGKGAPAPVPKSDDQLFDEYIASHHVDSTPEKTQEHARVAESSVPMETSEPVKFPSAWERMKDAAAYGWRRGNDEVTAAIRKGADVLSGGLEPKLAESLGSSETGRAMGFPAPGTYARTAAEHPIGSAVGGLTSAVGAGAGIAGQTAGAIGNAAGRGLQRLIPSLPAVARTGVEAGVGGAAYAGADEAVRGGSLPDIGKAAALGGGLSAAMGLAPAALGKAEEGLSRMVAKNDLKPVKQMSKKGSLDKSLSQFGAGDPEEGARQMVDFVQRENLGPVFRQKGQNAVAAYDKRMDDVWDKDLAPIYRYAKAAEPRASVPMAELETRLRATVRQEGGNEAELTEAAIKKLYQRNLDLRSRGGVPADEMPLDVVLTNARDFQRTGHAGVVNYDAPPASKEQARIIGRALRDIANERVARIYENHPEYAYQLVTGEQYNVANAFRRERYPLVPASEAQSLIASESRQLGKGEVLGVRGDDFAPVSKFRNSRYHQRLDEDIPGGNASRPGVSTIEVANGRGVKKDNLKVALDFKYDPNYIGEVQKPVNYGDRIFIIKGKRVGAPDDPGEALIGGHKIIAEIDTPAARKAIADLPGYAENIPKILANGNKRYSDYAKLQPVLEQASKLEAGEKRHGLIGLLFHGGTSTAAGLIGHTVAGYPGAIGAIGAVEAGRLAYPYGLRGAATLADTMGGPAVAPQSLSPLSSLATQTALGDRER